MKVIKKRCIWNSNLNSIQPGRQIQIWIQLRIQIWFESRFDLNPDSNPNLNPDSIWIQIWIHILSSFSCGRRRRRSRRWRQWWSCQLHHCSSFIIVAIAEAADGDNDEAAEVHCKVGDGGGRHCNHCNDAKRVKKNFWAFFMRQTAATAKAEQDQSKVWGGGGGGGRREREEEGEP